MRQITRLGLPARLGVFLLIVGLLALLGWRRGDPSAVPPDDWQIADLVAHLNDKGVMVRAVSTSQHGTLAPGEEVFLTTGDSSWEELNHLRAVPEAIDDWEGTVFCGRCRGNPVCGDRLLQWGDYAECRGRFIFFGDPGLRARISDALRQPPRAAPPTPAGIRTRPNASASAE